MKAKLLASAAAVVGLASIAFATPAVAAPSAVTKQSCQAQGGTFSQSSSTRTCTVTATGPMQSTYPRRSFSNFTETLTSVFYVTRTPTTTTTTTTRGKTTTQSSTTTYTYGLLDAPRHCFTRDAEGFPVVAPIADCETAGLYDLTRFLPQLESDLYLLDFR